MGAIGSHPVALVPLQPMAAPPADGGWRSVLRATPFARDRGGCQDRSMVSIGMVVLGATDMGRAIGFWTRALGYELREGGAGTDWSSLTPAGGLGTGIGLQRSGTPADAHPRVHLDLYAGVPLRC